MSPLGTSESITPSQDVWGWVEPDPEIRDIFGYHFQGPLGGSQVARVIFDIVDETVPELVTNYGLQISSHSHGGRTGGWNGDKTKFAVIRLVFIAGVNRHFLTYVDAVSNDPNDWAYVPDIIEVTSFGEDLAKQLKFVPPDGQSIARIWFRSSGSPQGRVSESVNINTGTRTVLGYETFFPGFTGHVYRHAWSPEGQWVAYTLEGNAPSGDGLFVFRRSDGALMYSDPFASLDDNSYHLHHFPEDSTLFVYTDGTNVKKLSTVTWTATSHNFPSAPRPNWVSPGALFYVGDGFTGPGRIWDANFNVVYSTTSAIGGDWNQEGTRLWGFIDGRNYTVSTPGYVATDVGLITDEQGWRMRPWL